MGRMAHCLTCRAYTEFILFVSWPWATHTLLRLLPVLWFGSGCYVGHRLSWRGHSLCALVFGLSVHCRILWSLLGFAPLRELVCTAMCGPWNTVEEEGGRGSI